MSTSQQSDQLREYLWVLRRRKWEIIVIAALVIAVTIFFTLRETKIYESGTEVLVNETVDPNTLNGPTAPDLPTETQVAMSSAVAQVVAKSGQLGTSAAGLASGLVVAPVAGTTSVLSISYQSPSPSFAARAANAFANAYIQFRDGTITTAYASALTNAEAAANPLHASINKINRELAGPLSPSQSSSLQGQRDSLLARLAIADQQVSQLESSAAANGDDAAQLIQGATVSSSPVKPDRSRNAVLAVIGGLLLGVVVALFRHRLDIRFKSPREFEEALEAPVLGSVPRVSGWRRSEDSLVMRGAPQSPAAEMLRTIATNLSYMARDHGARVVLITSALRGEGKTTTAANLALAVAQSGKRVVLVSGDLRRPRLHRLFGVSNEGVADVVSGSKSLTDVLADPGVSDLRFIGSGQTPRDPAVLLGSHGMAELMEMIREIQCDLVIMDCPPVLAVADASILVRYADAVLYVLDANQTSRSALAQAKSQLDRAGARILGGVFNNFNVDTRYPGDYSSYGGDEESQSDSGQTEHIENGRSKAPARPWARISR